MVYVERALSILLFSVAAIVSLKLIYDLIKSEIEDRRIAKELDRYTLRLTSEDYRQIAREQALREWRPVAEAWTRYAWTDRGERPPH